MIKKKSNPADRPRGPDKSLSGNAGRVAGRCAFVRCGIGIGAMRQKTD
jgi:hypothetical protein